MNSVELHSRRVKIHLDYVETDSDLLEIAFRVIQILLKQIHTFLDSLRLYEARDSDKIHLDSYVANKTQTLHIPLGLLKTHSAS